MQRVRKCGRYKDYEGFDRHQYDKYEERHWVLHDRSRGAQVHEGYCYLLVVQVYSDARCYILYQVQYMEQTN